MRGVMWRLISSGNLAMFAAIRRALARIYAGRGSTNSKAAGYGNRRANIGVISLQNAATNSKAVGGLRANGFALLPIEAGAIRDACPFHVSADAQGKKTPSPTKEIISRAWPRSSA
jgi:hypothetical protein